MKETITELPSLSFGQKLLGLTFNPTGDAKILRANILLAQLADMVHSNKKEEMSDIEQILYQHTLGEILNAKMNIVKFLTNEH